MTTEQIRDEQGYLTDLGHALGEERFHRFAQGQGELQAMALFLVMAVVTTPAQGYCDEALDRLIEDARDVKRAACTWADECINLAEDWRRQRRLEEIRQAEERRR